MKIRWHLKSDSSLIRHIALLLLLLVVVVVVVVGVVLRKPYLFIVYVMSLSVSRITYPRIAGCLVNNEEERI